MKSHINTKNKIRDLTKKKIKTGYNKKRQSRSPKLNEQKRNKSQ